MRSTDEPPLDSVTAAGRLLMALGGHGLAVDVAALGIPGSNPLPSDPAAAVSVRIDAETIIVAATPGGGGPCPRCLDSRWIGCRSMLEQQILDEPRGVVTSAAGAPAPHVIAIVVALVEAATEQTVPDAPIQPVWEVSTRTARISRYRLLKDSTCEGCAALPPDTPDGARVRLTSAPVAHPGATRHLAPEELRLPMDALANPVCGMLGRPPVRVYQSTATAPATGRFFARSKWGLHEMYWSGHAENYARSELLAVLEGLERDAGQRTRRVQVTRWARAAELDSPYVAMEQCGLYDPGFYRTHDTYVPWHENPKVPWVWGWSLRDDRAVLVPEQLVYYLDNRPGHRNTIQECSNGCASGGSVTEAVLHSVLELIERDAFIISWYSGITPPEIDLDTVAHPLVQQMRAHVDLLGYDLRCFDIRVDLPVPAVGAVAVRRDGGPGLLCFAGGASLDPADAVRAAVCEVATYVSGFPGRVTTWLEHIERMAADYDHVTELAHHALLFGLPEMARHAEHWLRQSSRVPLRDAFAGWDAGRAPVTDLAQAVRDIVDLLAGAGLDTVVVDQTTPEQRAVGLHTVATLAPGLVPIDFGWRRQRVLGMPRTRWAPYRAGLTPSPLRPEQLHLVPHPFP